MPLVSNHAHYTSRVECKRSGASVRHLKILRSGLSRVPDFRVLRNVSVPNCRSLRIVTGYEFWPVTICRLLRIVVACYDLQLVTYFHTAQITTKWFPFDGLLL